LYFGLVFLSQNFGINKYTPTTQNTKGRKLQEMNHLNGDTKNIIIIIIVIFTFLNVSVTFFFNSFYNSFFVFILSFSFLFFNPSLAPFLKKIWFFFFAFFFSS
jgi:hypothetical protein